MLTTLERALIEQREIRCAYASASHGGEIAQRSLQPYHLMPYHQSWMLIAFDKNRREILMFNVDRIQSCDVTSTVYAIPDDFDPQEYIGPSWGILRGEAGPVEDVVLHFNAEAAAWVRDHRWHYSQQVEECDDGSLVMRFCCVATNELVRWVLSYGGRVKVDEPGGLREAVIAEAKKVACACHEAARA
jgi:predicted DNA-binding transcriptional regulator YafY